MRTIALLLLTTAFACGESKETKSKAPAPNETNPGASAEVKPDEGKPVKKSEPVPLACDQWLAPDLLKTHCGVDLPLIDDGKTAQTSITCSRGAKQDSGGRISVAFEELIGGTMGPSVRRRFPDPPELVKHGSGMIVKGRRFPYLLTVNPSSYGKEPLCTDEQALALAKAILAKIPASEEPASKENQACDALLTSADIKATCNKEGSVNASMMEDGKSLYCNRGGSGLIFIVSQHASEDLAKRGAEVAREDTAAGVAHKGRFSIEMKTSVGSTTCDKAGLEALAKLVAERL